MTQTNYDRSPTLRVKGHDDAAWRGWESLGRELQSKTQALLATRNRVVLAVECYPGLHEQEVLPELTRRLRPGLVVESRRAMKPPQEIDRLVSPYLGGDDPIFGYLSPLELQDFFDADHRQALRRQIEAAGGLVLVYGAGATLCGEADLLVYADMPRWEGQLRQRRGEVSNLGVENAGLKASLQYKRSFFVDWRVCDRHKRATMQRWDYLLDTTTPDDPKLVTGTACGTGWTNAPGGRFAWCRSSTRRLGAGNG